MTAEQCLLKIQEILKEWKLPVNGEPKPQKFDREIAFDRFWKKYPSNRRDNKPRCQLKFKETIKDESDEARLHIALDYYLHQHDHVQNGFIKLSSTWLNQGWESWYEIAIENKQQSGIMKHLKGPQ